MALRSDGEGFLIGEPTEIETRGIARVIEILRSVKGDTAGILDLMRGKRSGAALPAKPSGEVIREASRAASPAARTGAARVSAAVPSKAMTGAQIAAVVATTIPVVADRMARASVAPARQPARPDKPRVRDEKGRFIGKAQTPNKPGKGGGDNGGGGRDDDPKSSSLTVGALKGVADAIRTGAGTAATGVDQVDPAFGAAREIGQMAAPVAELGKSAGKGLYGMWQDRRERRKRRLDAKENAQESRKANEPWFRRILKALGAIDSNGGGGLSGLLSGLLGGGGLLGRAGGLLGTGGALAGGMKAIRTMGWGGALKAVGKRFTPLAALMSAVDSFNTSTETYAARYGTREGESVVSDILTRTAGVLQDLGNALTFGLADRVGNFVAGNGFTRSAPDAKPRPIAKDEPAGTVSARGGGGAEVGRRLMGDLQRDYGLTREQAAGFVGNLSHETSGFTAMQEGKPLIPGSRGGYGYAQWTGPRRRQFEAWSAERGLSPASYEANYGFLRHELDNTPEGNVLPRLRRASSASEAALVVSSRFLRPGIPHMGRRIGAANDYAALPDEPAVTAQARIPAPAQVAHAVPAAPAGPARAAQTAAPASSQLALPAQPKEPPRQIGSNDRGPVPVQVNIPEQVGQNVADRGIAQVATGGIGGQTMNTRGM